MERSSITLPCYVDRDRMLGTQRKRHLTAEDAGWATAGTEPFGTIDTPLGRIGLVTGYDACFFETLRVLATLGADLVCVPANLPWSLSHRIARFAACLEFWQSKAWESCVALAVANYAVPGKHEQAVASGCRMCGRIGAGKPCTQSDGRGGGANSGHPFSLYAGEAWPGLASPSLV